MGTDVFYSMWEKLKYLRPDFSFLFFAYFSVRWATTLIDCDICDKSEGLLGTIDGFTSDDSSVGDDSGVWSKCDDESGDWNNDDGSEASSNADVSGTCSNDDGSGVWSNDDGSEIGNSEVESDGCSNDDDSGECNNCNGSTLGNNGAESEALNGDESEPCT